MQEQILVKMTKLSDNQNALRTNEIEGFCFELPQVGQPFVMYGEGIEFGTRIVSTSLVQEVADNKFKTLNSQYQLDVLSPKQ